MALYVRMSVAGANKVEGILSGCLGTNAILASIHNEPHRLSNQKNFVYQAEIGD